jgi:aspartate/methionine/tyrosine aminotransferase
MLNLPGYHQFLQHNPFSKDPNLAGYRLGYILAAPAVIERLRSLAPILYGNPTVMARIAAIEVSDDPASSCKQRKATRS